MISYRIHAFRQVPLNVVTRDCSPDDAETPTANLELELAAQPRP